jgi:xanthine dehydrogenase accessory factor
MINQWLNGVQQCEQDGHAYVLATVIAISGSTPREAGAKMVIAEHTYIDTIGGGHLEFQTIASARELLAQQTVLRQQQVQHFQLSSQLGQCCGGTVSVLLEYFPANLVNIMLFGAGHVAKALVPILAGLPCRVSWVDSRADEFPHQYVKGVGNGAEYRQPNIRVLASDDELGEISTMPAHSYYLVMTHNHQLDFELCQAILRRDDFHYLGLIASNTKWRRFAQRLKHREFSPEQISRIDSPIGLTEIRGKRPMEVAVSIAGQLISLYQQQHASEHNNNQGNNMQNKHQSGLAWSEVKALLLAQEQQAKEQQHD